MAGRSVQNALIAAPLIGTLDTAIEQGHDQPLRILTNPYPQDEVSTSFMIAANALKHSQVLPPGMNEHYDDIRQERLEYAELSVAAYM